MVEAGQIANLLRRLPDGYGRKVAVGGLRSAVRPMVKQMKSNASSISRKISKSIGIKDLKKARYPTVSVGIQRTLMDRVRGFYWRFWEYGTQVRKPRKKKYLIFWSVQLGRLIKTKSVRPIPERPFLRPAVDATKDQVKEEVVLNIRKSLVRFLRRHKKKFAV